MDRSDITDNAMLGLAGGVAAALLNVGIRTAAGFGGVPIGSTMSLGIAPLVVVSLISAVGATVVYTGLEYFDRKKLFLPASVAVLLLSFVPFVAGSPQLEGVPTSAIALLGFLHLTTAAPIIYLLFLYRPES
jgi:hypothetical protein